ncbi:hypothetical protein KM043_018335 [Ampulex compressa]|nr:hypothetical protein KM043_018335 [Ampulex compressa]
MQLRSLDAHMSARNNGIEFAHPGMHPLSAHPGSRPVSRTTVEISTCPPTAGRDYSSLLRDYEELCLPPGTTSDLKNRQRQRPIEEVNDGKVKLQTSSKSLQDWLAILIIVRVL